MTPRLLLEPAAESEFLEAAGWYAERSPSLGAAFRTSVATTLTTIEEAPHRFPIALRDIQKARVPRFPYVVYYVPLTEVIVVIAIIHGRRDPRRWHTRR